MRMDLSIPIKPGNIQTLKGTRGLYQNQSNITVPSTGRGIIRDEPFYRGHKNVKKIRFIDVFINYRFFIFIEMPGKH